MLDGGAHRTQRPVTDIGAGPLWLDVPFVPAPGQKLDDRFGPSTELRVSATPPELLLSGRASASSSAATWSSTPRSARACCT